MNRHAAINMLKGRSCDNCRWNAMFWVASKTSPRKDNCLKDVNARQSVSDMWDDVKPKERICHAWVGH